MVEEAGSISRRWRAGSEMLEKSDQDSQLHSQVVARCRGRAGKTGSVQYTALVAVELHEPSAMAMDEADSWRTLALGIDEKVWVMQQLFAESVGGVTGYEWEMVHQDDVVYQVVARLVAAQAQQLARWLQGLEAASPRPPRYN